MIEELEVTIVPSWPSGILELMKQTRGIQPCFHPSPPAQSPLFAANPLDHKQLIDGRYWFYELIPDGW